MTKLSKLFIYLCLSTLLSTTSLAAAKVKVGAMEMDAEGPIDTLPGDVSDSVEEEVEEKEKGVRKGELVAAPLPSRSPLLGWSIALPVMYIYKPKNSDKEDRPWVSGVAGFYTENDSFGAGAFQKMSLGGDKWRLMGSAFTAELNYDYFGIGGDQSFVIPLKQKMTIGLVEALREVGVSDLFAGVRYIYSTSKVSTTIGEELLPPNTPPLELAEDYTLSTIAPRVVYDTRKNEFYPTDSWLVEGQIGIAREELGSDTNYEKFELAINNYSSLGAKGVLATRISTKYVDGDVPFFLYPAFGGGADLRGYETGTYRDRFLFAAQTEYRYRITPRNGITAFVGIGTVNEKFGRWGKSLPAVGVGYRFVLATKNDVSLRIDIAHGRDDDQFYVGVGEAF